MKDKKFKLYALLISLIILLMVVLRAANTGITWDEAFSYNYYANNLKVAIDSAFENGEVLANNHIINSIMIATLVEITGAQYNEFIIRLPNIIMLILYLFASYCISKDEKYKYLLFTGLVSNYYMMEYFGLARGYGIATALTLVMLAYFKKSIKNNYESKYIVLSVVFGILACYANSVALIGVGVIGIFYFIAFMKNKKLLQFIKKNYVYIIFLIIPIIYIMIYHLRVTGGEKPVFGAKNGINDFLIHGFVWMYTKNTILIIVANLFLFFTTIITCIVSRKKIIEKKFLLLLLLLIFTLIIPFKVLGKPYLIERCLLPFVPFLILGLYDIYEIWAEKLKDGRKKYLLEKSVVLLLIIVFIIKINLNETSDFNDNYPVKGVAYEILHENRKITNEEMEKYKGIYSLYFYKEKIMKEYGYNIFE